MKTISRAPMALGVVGTLGGMIMINKNSIEKLLISFF